MTLDQFLERFDPQPIGDGAGFKALCPCHEDHEPSLAISAAEDGKILVTCRAGCALADVLSALGLGLKDLFPDTTYGPKQIVAEYRYVDAAGVHQDTKLRYRPKDFKWRRPDGTFKRSSYRGLYRLPELRAADPSLPVFVVEGEKDVDRLVSMGAVATTSPDGATKGPLGKKWLDRYTTDLAGRTVVVIADQDEPGLLFARHVATCLLPVAKAVTLIDSLPMVKDKGDISDYFDHRHAGVQTHTLQSLLDHVDRVGPFRVAPTATPVEPVEPCTLDEAHAVVRRWFGESYDMAAFDAMLATLAAERLSGDPLWILFISGPGFTKTETIQCAAGAGALVTSTIASEGALLSGTTKKEQAKDATGGLLRKIGSSGVLVIKDFTTILSMNKEARASVLAALREIYDGKWERNLGASGGVTLTWTGKIAVIGACTSAWDSAHSVISSMGDRFVIFRLDSTQGRLEAGTQALLNVGHEVEMRSDLAQIVGRVLAGINPQAVDPSDIEKRHLLLAADLVTRCRTSVNYDYQGKVIGADQPEAPTRFAKQLMQVFRGACSLGVDSVAAMTLALRCACDSMPPLRLEILRALERLGRLKTYALAQELNKPYTTVDRQVQSLHQLGLVDREVEETEVPGTEDEAPKTKQVWFWTLAPTIHLSPEMLSEGEFGELKREQREPEQPCLSTNLSGEGFVATDIPY